MPTKALTYNQRRSTVRHIRDRKVYKDYYRMISNGIEDPIARKICEEYYELSYYLVSRAITTGLKYKWHLKIKK